MPYISAEEVKQKRSAIKKAFPGFKFSITREHHSSIKVNILEAPLNLLTNGKTYEQINHYYIGEHYKDAPEIKEILLKVYEIMTEGRKIISKDADYGSIQNFYTNISIGRWDRPFNINN